MAPHEKLAVDLYRTCLLRGDFVLRSGGKSDRYFDKYLFEADPVLLWRVASSMQRIVDRTERMLPDPPGTLPLLAGLETGGIPLVVMLSQLTMLPALFVRKEAKTYGTCKLAEGPDFKERPVIVIEDVITKGGSVVRAIADLRERGACISHVLAVVDRESGGQQALREIGVTLHALFTLSELEAAGA